MNIQACGNWKFLFQLYETPFFIAFDHQEKLIIVTIRGTLSLYVSYSSLYYNSLLAFPSDRYRQKVGLAGPWERATLTRQRESASPGTRTRWLMKRPTAQLGGARMKRDSRAWHHGRRGVYIYN